MPQTAYQVQDLPHVEAELNYVIDTGSKPVTHIVPMGAGPNTREETPDLRTVPIYDGRAVADRITLDGSGFALMHHDSAMTDFLDSGEVESVWNPEVEEIVKRATGASRVVVFDHTIRADDEETQKGHKTREPVRVIHNDYTEKSGPQRVRDLLPADEAEAALNKRYVFVNVWRSIRGAVEEAPIAICDGKTIPDADFIPTDLKYNERVGEIYRATYNPEHRWVYFPQMQPDEVLLLKCFDTERDGRARWTAHTAFDDPTTPVGAPPRQSIETRTIAFYDE